MRTDRGHGSPYDRGKADYWYSRPFSPHCYDGPTALSPRVTYLTAEELADYRAGWDAGEAWGERKDWD